MTAQVVVEELEQREYALWSRLVADSPDGSIYATPEYLDVLSSTAGGRFRILAARRGDELVGGLPLYERPTGRGVWVAPRLLLYYLGPVLRRFDTKYPSQETARQIAILGALAEAVASRGYAKVVLKPRHTLADLRPFLVRGWRSWPTYSYVVSLADLPTQWQRVEQNLRRLIERCDSNGLRLTEDDDFDGFLRLHRQTMERVLADAYLPDPGFRRWYERLREMGFCRLFQARVRSGEPVAVQLVLLGPHPTTHTVCAAADPAYRQLGASAFLRWKVFEVLARAGKSQNDLTDAALNSVTHFKSQFGADLVLNLVVETPGSFRWKVGESVSQLRHGVRSKVAGVLRPLLGARRT
ncbi:MAG: GNAT family N-acetyltransferase [Gemmatimonadales bacterium]